ncbi:MAG: glycosyltransferase family 10 domain-containing protein [Halobaculum sp.]
MDVIDQIGVDETDVAIFVGLRNGLDYYEQLRNRSQRPVMVYIAREPPVYTPQHSERELIKLQPLFDLIFTWNDRLADIDGFAKYHWPIADEQLDRSPPDTPYEDRTLLTTVSSMTASEDPNELYTERERIVSFYDRNHPDAFSLYGRKWTRPINGIDICEGRWQVPDYSVYRGEAEQKAAVYSRHKFALVFENQTGIDGWVSEKLFDAFASGAVPVYWGASNVEEYIPSETFVDYREFATPQALHDHLTSMSRSQYEAYRDAIRRYLDDGVGPFAADRVADRVYERTMALRRDRSGQTPPRARTDGGRSEGQIHAKSVPERGGPVPDGSDDVLADLRDEYEANSVSYGDAVSEFVTAIEQPPSCMTRTDVVRQFFKAAVNELIRGGT